MNKKLISAGILLFILIISVGIVSAQGGDAKSIHVSATGDMPGSITVSLLCDGKVVDSATLSNGNSWSKTFKVNDDGHYTIVANDNPDYSMSVSGNEDNGFVVYSKHVGEKLAASNDDPVRENDSSNDDVPAANNISDVNVTDDNATDDDVADDNGTDDNATVPGDVIDNSSDKNTNKTDKIKNNSNVNKTVYKNKIVKKETKKPAEKKENKTNKVKLRNTGLPLVVLVIAAFVAIFIPLSRKK